MLEVRSALGIYQALKQIIGRKLTEFGISHFNVFPFQSISIFKCVLLK